MSTLILSRSEVQRLLDPMDVEAGLRQGFVSYSRSYINRPQRVWAKLPSGGTATVLFPGLTPDQSAYMVKVHAKFPQQNPAIRGVLCLHCLSTGELLAVIDSTHITAVRTGLAGSMAAHRLARTDADAVAIVGAGVQGRQQLSSLARMRSIRSVFVYDLNETAAEDFAVFANHQLMLTTRVCSSVTEAVRDAGIVLVATWSRNPIIDLEMLQPGAHVTTLGVDEPGKAELSPRALCASSFFCDDRELAHKVGALAFANLPTEFVATELGDVLSGAHPGRTSDDELTVYAGVGLAFQDAICARAVYASAIEKAVGLSVDFLA